MTDQNPTPWVEGRTIGDVLAESAARHADREAFVFPQAGVRWTYPEFNATVDRAARGLLALGVRPGEHVAVWATNVPRWVVLQFATARIGAVLTTINPAYRPFELQYVLRQSDAAVLFLVDAFKSSDYYAMLAEVAPGLAQGRGPLVSANEFPKLRHVVTIKERPLAGALAWHELERLGEQQPNALESVGRLEPEAAINIQYTSGTTGFPKAATLSHRNLLLNAWHIGACQQFTPDDRICVPVPFYHCFGCVLGTLASVVHGATLISPAESFQPAATLDALERERATAVYGVPTMFIALLEDPSFPQRDLRHLRTGIMAGSPCPIEVMRKVTGAMGAREMTIAYGQTEASPVITQSRTDDPLDVRVETVGRPLPGVEVKLVDPATGATLPDNTQGELCARGHGVMLGYYGDAEATQRAIDAEGWLHTGDLALRQTNGCFRITGRLKDMVIRGGENIYPREIEEFLFRHPAIEQAAVVGVPDVKFVEELCAWIKLRPGHELSAEDVRGFCRAHLAHYKTPRYVKFVDAFPQTVTGKIQKFVIREQMIAELGLTEQATA